MLPHVHIHRRCDDHRRGRGEVQRSQKIVGDAAREFGDDVCGGRSNEQEIGALRHRNVLDGALEVGGASGGIAEEVGDDFLAGERGEGKRRDKLARGASHHHLHGETVLLKPAR